MTTHQVRKQMSIARTEVWEVQKNAYRKRIEWLETNLQDIDSMAGNLDRDKTRNVMQRLKEERVINGRMTRTIQ